MYVNLGTEGYLFSSVTVTTCHSRLPLAGLFLGTQVSQSISVQNVCGPWTPSCCSCVVKFAAAPCPAIITVARVASGRKDYAGSASIELQSSTAPSVPGHFYQHLLCCLLHLNLRHVPAVIRSPFPSFPQSPQTRAIVTFSSRYPFATPPLTPQSRRLAACA